MCSGEEKVGRDQEGAASRLSATRLLVAVDCSDGAVRELIHV